MSVLLNIINPLHKQTKRKYIERMVDEKVFCMKKAKEYEYDYWDGDRRFGYGGYKYIENRWTSVAQQLIDIYDLKKNARILDVGCGKAYLLYELKQLLDSPEIVGFDISKHALDNAKEEIRENLFRYNAHNIYPWGDKYFDLVISLGCLHNLKIFELKTTLSEIERVGKNKYIMVESYRNEQELFNLQCWALTCESFYDTASWIWLFKHFNYSGDYEFIYFE